MQNPAQFEATDEALVRLAVGGEQSAYTELYNRYHHQVKATLITLRRTIDADDLVQETFANAFRKLDSFRYAASFSTWLYRVTVNTFLMSFRKKRVAAVSLNEMLEALHLENRDNSQLRALSVRDMYLEGAVDRVTIDKLLEDIPSGCREVLILHHIYGLEHHEVAKVLGCAIGNSKSQLHRAKIKLRTALSKGSLNKLRRRMNEYNTDNTDTGMASPRECQDLERFADH